MVLRCGRKIINNRGRVPLLLTNVHQDDSTESCPMDTLLIFYITPVFIMLIIDGINSMPHDRIRRSAGPLSLIIYPFFLYIYIYKILFVYPCLKLLNYIQKN